MSEKQGTHFWMMVIQTPNGLGVHVDSYQGTWSPRREDTRFDMFNKIRADVERRDPRSRNGVVVAFDIQPNKL